MVNDGTVVNVETVIVINRKGYRELMEKSA